MMQNLQNTIIGSGIVSNAYNIGADLLPLISPMVSNLLEPYLVKQFSQLPDESIPALARDVLTEAEKQGSYTVMDGFLTLDINDIKELKSLIEKNLPIMESEHYTIIT